MTTEGRKLVTVDRGHGVALVSADLHGHWGDFGRLREIFLQSEARGEDPIWISVGDWVHGPSTQRDQPLLGSDGVPLYDYPDESVRMLSALFSLMDQYPGRVLSLCGNHEHSHIGGPRTRKFHEDEAAHLESLLTAEAVDEMHRRFVSWPIAIRLASSGVLITHGAPSPDFEGPGDWENAHYRGSLGAARRLLESTMSHYGFAAGADAEVLRRIGDSGGPPYHLIVHGHDREEEGFSRSADSALLLCTSFGARQDRKAYLRLDLSRRYRTLDDLREGIELLRLHDRS